MPRAIPGGIAALKAHMMTGQEFRTGAYGSLPATTGTHVHRFAPRTFPFAIEDTANQETGEFSNRYHLLVVNRAKYCGVDQKRGSIAVHSG